MRTPSVLFIRTPNPIVLKPWTGEDFVLPRLFLWQSLGILTTHYLRMCEDDLIRVIIKPWSSSGAWCSIMSASCPVDIPIYHPGLNDHPHQLLVSQKQRPGLLQVISKCPPGILTSENQEGLQPACNILIPTELKSYPGAPLLRLPPSPLSFPSKAEPSWYVI